MGELFIRNLENHGSLSGEDKDALAVTRVRDYAAREDIVRHGQEVTESCTIMSGFAWRYKVRASEASPSQAAAALAKIPGGGPLAQRSSTAVTGTWSDGRRQPRASRATSTVRRVLERSGDTQI
jgi:hypothetical protein